MTSEGCNPAVTLDARTYSKARSDRLDRNGRLAGWIAELNAFRSSGFGANSVGIRIESTGLVLNGLVDLTAMDGDMLGRFDAETNLVSANLDHGHRDVVVDDDALVLLAGENQHCRSSLVLIAFGADRLVAVSGNQVQAKDGVQFACSLGVAHTAFIELYMLKAAGQGDGGIFISGEMLEI